MAQSWSPGRLRVLGWVPRPAERLRLRDVIRATTAGCGVAPAAYTEDGRTCVDVHLVGDVGTPRPTSSPRSSPAGPKPSSASARSPGRRAVIGRSCHPHVGPGPEGPAAGEGREDRPAMATRSTLLPAALARWPPEGRRCPPTFTVSSTDGTWPPPRPPPSCGRHPGGQMFHAVGGSLPGLRRPAATSPAIPSRDERMPDTSATINEHRLHETDTGSPEVQVALLTERINHLTDAPEGPQEGPSLPSGPAHARGPAAPAARLPQAQRRREVPGAHRQPRPSPVGTTNGQQRRCPGDGHCRVSVASARRFRPPARTLTTGNRLRLARTEARGAPMTDADRRCRPPMGDRART